MQNLKLLASLYSWAGWFESYMVTNPKDRFSPDETHFQYHKNLKILDTRKIAVIEPQHDKTNKVSVRPAKTQIRSESLLYA